MLMCDYLYTRSEKTPEWLTSYKVGDNFPYLDFLSSRIVYYPGHGADGQPIQLFSSSHSAHCYVYADYGLSRKSLESDLDHPTKGFRGYYTLDRIDVSVRNLFSVHRKLSYHYFKRDVFGYPKRNLFSKGFNGIPPYGFIEILERNHDYSDEHGPERLAILFLGLDGIVSYDALFCQKGSISPPFVVVLQQHGFSGNYDTFERGGLLEHIVTTSRVYPSWLLVARGTESWAGFSKVQNVGAVTGGMYATRRYLYTRDLHDNNA